MGKVVVSCSVSLDGFSAGPDISMEEPMGRGGERLHTWLFRDGMADSVDGEVVRAERAEVAAVVLGRRTFDLGLPHWGDTPWPAPSFVLTHEVRDPMPMSSAAFTFVNDGVASAVGQARAAAGGGTVLVMGCADVAQQAIRAGLVDELRLQVVPVLLGGGTRLLDNLGPEQVELELVESIESPVVTHLRYRVRGR